MFMPHGDRCNNSGFGMTDVPLFRPGASLPISLARFGLSSSPCPPLDRLHPHELWLDFKFGLTIAVTCVHRKWIIDAKAMM
jgi:hypothetical protein